MDYKYKIDILSRDEFDKGERKFLNYGHTFGHALESVLTILYLMV
jgi:3-dehydroquinate synthetase